MSSKNPREPKHVNKLIAAQKAKKKPAPTGGERQIADWLINTVRAVTDNMKKKRGR